MENDPRVRTRAAGAPPEELAAGTDDGTGQAEAIIEESDARQADRDAAPDTAVEHRTSQDATPPA